MAKSRWWDIEVATYTEVAEEVVPGKWDCWTDYDMRLLKIELACPGLIPARVAEIAPDWQITQWGPGLDTGINDDVF